MSNSDEEPLADVPPTPIQISSSLADEVGDDGVQKYVAIIVDAERSAIGRPPGEVAEELSRRFEQEGLPTNETVDARIAEVLVNPDRGGLAMITDDGKALHGEADVEGGKPAHRDTNYGPLFS